MKVVLQWLRHLLILIPAIGTLNSQQITSYAVYTALVLTGLLVVRLRTQWPDFLPSAMFCTEIAFLGYLNYSYGGILYLCHASTLVSLVELQPARKRFSLPNWLAALLPAAVMNIALAVQEPLLETILLANIVYVSVCLLLFVIETATVQKQEMESLYDELNRSHMELKEARKRLLQYAKQVEEHAQLEERSRIMKDIHDDLGHRLIRQKMMIEAILHIREADPEKAARMTEQVRDQMTESMETLRRTVRNMAPAAQASRRYSLGKLIEEAGEYLGIDVNYRIEGLPYPLYPSLEYILYRNAQEAITNAIRHGNATEVDITLAYSAEQVALRVRNNGSSPDPDAAIRKGVGLRGMEERAALVGGRIEYEARSPFTMTTFLPHYRRTEIEGGTP